MLRNPSSSCPFPQSIWPYFIYGTIFINLLWGAFFIYHISVPDIDEIGCASALWFYATYGTAISCCYLVFLYVALPKRIIQRRDYSIVQASLNVSKFTLVFSLIFLVNNFTLFIAALKFHLYQQVCTGSFALFICKTTFLISWFTTSICCVYLHKAFKRRSQQVNQIDPQENRIELIQILI